MKFTHWTGGGYDRAAAGALERAGYPPLLSALLAARGIQSPQQAEPLLTQDKTLSTSPFLMKDMDRAAARVERALEAGEKIAVYGDYDVDGITSTVLLTDYLRTRGADCSFYIPRRVEDGYGLGKEALLSLREQGVTLVITVDCGITGVEEARYAREIGLSLVITDHHECKEALPQAEAVVDPRRADCPYPFKHLAGVGVALKLVLALGKGREAALFERYCALAAVGTIADVMQMTGENRIIVHRGLESLRETEFIGLRALLREAGIKLEEVRSAQIGFVLAPRINAAGRMGEAELAARLLLTRDPAQAESMARELCLLNRERQSVEQDIFAQAVELVEALPPQERHALVLSSESWHQGVVGIVASRLSEKYACPCFMIHLQNGVGKGSCRSYGGFNLFAALESAQELLVDFGGHELAAGFNIREENIPAFRARMNTLVQTFLGGEKPKTTLALDVVLRQPGRLRREDVRSLDRLEPYGPGAERPVFAILGAKLEQAQNVGQNRHLKLRLRQGNCLLDGIFFSMTVEECGVRQGDYVDAAFYLQLNEFRGSVSIQLQLIDLRPAEFLGRPEREALALVRSLVSGEALSREAAARLLPEREQFEALWRGAVALSRAGQGEKSSYVSLLRHLSLDIGGEHPFSRAALCLEVFQERGLLFLERDGYGLVTLRFVPGQRADLEECPYIRKLRGEGGGRDGQR